jgi:hypothetical protein
VRAFCHPKRKEGSIPEKIDSSQKKAQNDN